MGYGVWGKLYFYTIYFSIILKDLNPTIPLNIIIIKSKNIHGKMHSERDSALSL